MIIHTNDRKLIENGWNEGFKNQWYKAYHAKKNNEPDGMAIIRRDQSGKCINVLSFFDMDIDDIKTVLEEIRGLDIKEVNGDDKR